ncbi:MAG: hypothetical protein HC843_04560 [Sphingomonadales bacterium]|nr:hypothetical protein [Sphingomonadales bacterium]
MSGFNYMLRAFAIFLSIVSLMHPAFTPAVHASVESEMGTYYNDMSSATYNVTGPSAFTSQSMGYYSGGSIYARFPQKNLYPVNLQLPSAKAGCGGIDIFTGSFSFANSDQYVAMAKSVINSAKGYVFKLAISALSGLIGAQLSDVQGIINSVNSANINSCELAQQGVNSLLSEMDLAQSLTCRQIASTKGDSSDWSAAMEDCARQGFRNQASTSAAQSSNPDVKAVSQQDPMSPRNITWKMLKTNGQFSSRDNSFNEMMMNIVGTVIVSRENENSPNNIAFYGGNLDTVMQVMLYGGSADIYVCDTYSENGCMKPTPKNRKIESAGSIRGLVLKDLQGIKSAIQNNRKLTNTELALVQNTTVPVYKIMLVTVSKGGSYLADSEIEVLADLVAFDMIDRMLTSLSSEITNTQTAVGNATGAEMAQWRQQFDAVQSKMAGTRQQVIMRVEILQSLLGRTQILESSLKNGLSSQLQASMGFARTLREAGVR